MVRYGSPESILLLLFKRVTGTRHVGSDDIPSLMDEYDLYEDLYFGRFKEDNQAKLTKMKGLYEFINHLNPPLHPEIHIPFRILVQQATLFAGVDRIDKIYSRLVKYGMVKEKTNNLIKRIELASNWADDHSLDGERFEFEMNDNQRKAIVDLIEFLKSFIGSELNPSSPKELQTRVFAIARDNTLEPKEFFVLLYRVLINSDKGPRIGNYLLDLGIERTCNILEKYLNN